MALKKYRERFSDIGIFENGVYPGIAELLPTLKSTGQEDRTGNFKARRLCETYS